MKRAHILLIILALLIVAFLTKPYWPEWIIQRLSGQHTVSDRIDQYGAAARQRMRPRFAQANIPYPPAKITMVGIKRERKLYIYASSKNGKLRLVRSYPILAASGKLGPKLKYGDGQVPEGLYRITWLNANSSYHLSMRLDYPNDFDRKMGLLDGREDLGRDIMIHGKRVSVGCLAMGDEASEDLFVLAHDTGIDNIKVILCPVDFSTTKLPKQNLNLPRWTPQLYRSIRKELNVLPSPIATSP